MMWSAGGASRLLEVDTTDRSYDNFFADEMEAYKTAAEALASERGRLLSAVGNAVNAVLSTGLTSSDGLRCDAPVVRDLFLALEASLEHHLLPPLFSLGGATLWYCLVQVQQASRRGHAGNGNQPSGGPLQLPAEAVALARGLSEKHLSTTAPNAPSAVRDAYAARLWLCLALRRRVLSEWVEAIAIGLTHAYADGSLLTTADERSMLVDLLVPLCHVSFHLPERAPRKHLAAFLALPGGADSLGPGGLLEEVEYLPSEEPAAEAPALEAPAAEEAEEVDNAAPSSAASSSPVTVVEEAVEEEAEAPVVSEIEASSEVAEAPAAVETEAETPQPPPKEVEVVTKSKRSHRGQRTGGQRRNAPVAAPILDAAPSVKATNAASVAAALVAAAPAADAGFDGAAEATTEADALVSPLEYLQVEEEKPAADVVASSSITTADAPASTVDEAPSAAVDVGDNEEAKPVLDAGVAAAPSEAPAAAKPTETVVAAQHPLFDSTRDLVRSGKFSSLEAVRLQTAAASAAPDVTWHQLLRAADALVDSSSDTADGDDDETRSLLLGECRAADRVPLLSPGGDTSAPPAALLRRVSTRRGLHLFIGISGLLSKYEGDLAEESTQAMQLAACWQAAAAFFGIGDWWSLTWGGAPLAALAAEISQNSGALVNASNGGNGQQPSNGALETAAALAQAATTQAAAALALRGPWGACYDAAKAAGAALAQTLRRRGCGSRPVTLLGVSLGARVVWQCLEILAALPAEESNGLIADPPPRRARHQQPEPLGACRPLSPAG